MPMSVPHALLINPAQAGDARLLVNICVVTAGSETARPCWVLERIISLERCLLVMSVSVTCLAADGFRLS